MIGVLKNLDEAIENSSLAIALYSGMSQKSVYREEVEKQSTEPQHRTDIETELLLVSFIVESLSD